MKKPKNTSSSSHVIILTKDKDCKGSVRFVTDDEKAIITNVYVSRPFADDKETIKLIVK